ncbi:helix-turn-helix domain-containing protein [Haladaptatus halobius]|uniref:helix-turn-helix domain-containing protein n=1 Tax=Haladaptatus halobius TaxID=2884875 RepID=UPI001D0A9479|nr:helix-turn-helix domain-containing protein [Haladaptatus halobius]
MSEPDPQRFRELMLAEEPGFEDVLRCVFSIQPHESHLYLTLLEQPNSTMDELASVTDRDRTNISRSLATLREKGLASRYRRLLDDGGHVYRHEPTSLDEAKDLMHYTLDEWSAYVHTRIDDFGDGSL